MTPDPLSVPTKKVYPLKVLFVKESLQWPRSSGHDVHCFYMMQAMQRQGVDVSLLTGACCQAEAVAGLDLVSQQLFTDLPPYRGQVQLPRLQERFCSYWGTDKSRIGQIADLVERNQFDAVIVVGLDVLPYLAKVKTAKRIWYAADEWLLHHFSQLKVTRPSSWSELRPALIKGLYEFAFSNSVDRVWVVSDKDANTARWIMPGVGLDVIANGVDFVHFDPAMKTQVDVPSSGDLTFWGRLDFGPNLDAIEWFCGNVWAPLRREHPEITWTVYGFKAGDQIRQLADRYQFKLVAELPDLRREILGHKIVVLPFVSGAGIKNKFLEAASLAMPIIASKRALNGVHLYGCTPCRVATSPKKWIANIETLLADSTARSQLGSAARDWVIEYYSWQRAGELGIASVSGQNR